MTVQTLLDKFRSLAGDDTKSIPSSFLVNGLNWAFNSLSSVPGLGAVFSTHCNITLDANGHFRWDLVPEEKFRYIGDIPVLNFFTSTGGDPCPLPLCPMDTDDFYRQNGVVELKQAGKPCTYTIEREDDHCWLVLDRPSNIPIMVDYICYGYPKPVTALTDTVELSAPVENLILNTLRKVFYEEADDLAFAGAFGDYLDNKYLPEVIQMINKRFGSDAMRILGEN